MKFYLTIIFTIFFLACNSQSSKDTEIWEPVPKKVYSKYKWRVKKSIKDILKETLHTLNKNKSYLSKIL